MGSQNITLNNYVAATPAGMFCVVRVNTGVEVNPGNQVTYGQGQPAQPNNCTTYASSDTVPTYGTLSGATLSSGAWEWNGSGISGGFLDIMAWYCTPAEKVTYDANGIP